MRRVVITGLGPVSSIGIGATAFETGLREGRCGSSPIASFDTEGFPHIYAGEVNELRPAEILERLDPRNWGLSAVFAACAARLAVRDARLDLHAIDLQRLGVVIGTTCGESRVLEKLTEELRARGFERMSPELLRQLATDRLAYGVSEELGSCGESITLSTACSASNYAIGYAYDQLATGNADVMVAGGADSVCRWVHAGFFRLGTLAKQLCIPFDRDRSGILTAEGGAALVLETLEHALARGATPYAEVLGYALNCDADHMVAPNATSIAACMQLAHARAGVSPADIDYICAHGTGTPTNDYVEVQAIRQVFGERIPPVSSIKSMLGHTMGAACGFGAIASTMAIRDGFLPPTINWKNEDPGLGGIDMVANAARTTEVKKVQNNGFAFGGNNAIVVFGAVA